MPDLIAYALNREHDGTVTHEDGTEGPLFLGGVIAVDDNRELNIGELLNAGDGTIVVEAEDANAVRVLDEYPALKRTAAPADATPDVGRYDGLTVPDLKRELSARDLPLSGARGDLVARLEESDAGEPVPPNPTPPPAVVETTEEP